MSRGTPLAEDRCRSGRGRRPEGDQVAMDRIQSFTPRPVSPTSLSRDDEERARYGQLLARVPLFKDLSADGLTDLIRRVQPRKVPVHASIVAQDETGDALFVIF